MWERDSTGDPFVCKQLCAFQRGSSRASFKLTIFKIIIEDNKLLEFAKHFTYSKCFDKSYLTWSSHLLLHNLVVVSSLISFVKDQSETREVWWFAQDHTVITVRTRMRILVLYQVILWSQVHLYSLKFRNPNRNNVSYLSFPNSFSQNVTWPELLWQQNSFWDDVKLFIVLFRENIHIFYYRNFNVFNHCQKLVYLLYEPYFLHEAQ